MVYMLVEYNQPNPVQDISSITGDSSSNYTSKKYC